MLCASIKKRIACQEAILASVIEAIAHEKKGRINYQDKLRSRFNELREAATGFHSQSGRQDTDLPMLYEQMHYNLSLAARTTSSLPSSKAPYFAYIKVKEGETEKQYLLGYASFISVYSPYSIIDWRNAPLARIFFEFRVGDDYEVELPGRVARGIVLERSIVSISEGKLVGFREQNSYFYYSHQGWNLANGHEATLLAGGQGAAHRSGAFLGRSMGTSKEAISSLLDKKQYRMMTNFQETSLLILGGAGSGKTTVAVHRMAQLCFEDKGYFSPDKMLFVVPEPGLVYLVRSLFRAMGLGKITTQTYDDWLRGQIRLFKGLSRKIYSETPPEIRRLKRQALFTAVIKKYVQKKSLESPSWLKASNWARDRVELLTDTDCLAELKAAQIPNLDALLAQLIRYTIDQDKKPLKASGLGYDRDRMIALDGHDVEWMTPDEKNGTIDLEDIPLLLELAKQKQLAGGKNVIRGGQYHHVAIDEAQEFSVIELRSLRLALQQNATLTVAGDSCQNFSKDSHFIAWEATLEALGVDSFEKQTLVTNYRSPLPVHELAKEILRPLNVVLPESSQDGPGVKITAVDEKARVLIQIVDELADLRLREPQSSIALICRDEEGALSLYVQIKDLIDIRLVLDGSFSFKPGIDVTAVSAVKGLEFDYVVIPDLTANQYKSDRYSRGALYVAVSRTMHQLWLCHVRPFSKIIKIPEALG